MDFNNILNGLKTEVSQTVTTEFGELLVSAKNDSSKFIQESAEELKRALTHLAEGKLSAKDVNTLLEKHKTLAELEANKAKIETATRIRKIVVRLFELAINIFVKAISASAKKFF